MKRRQFIRAFGCALVLKPVLARAQQRGKVPLVGILDTDDTAKFESIRFGAFEETLRDRGWINGKSIRLERRVVGTQAHLIPSMAADLVALAPDVLVSTSTLTTAALAERSKSIPIVFLGVFDPIASGFSDGLSRPSRNMTGFTVFDPALGGKTLQLLKDLKPAIRRVTMISNSDAAPGRSTATALFVERTTQFGRDLNIEFKLAEVRSAADIETTISSLGPEDGLSVAADQFLWANRRLITDLTARYRIPAIYSWYSYVDEGGLMAYTVDVEPFWRGAASYVDQLLRGISLAELPIQQPKTFALVINLATARALDLTVPRELLVQARRTVE
jgi:putative tryptophan/tyrosine transport system substrate-binding protein